MTMRTLQTCLQVGARYGLPAACDLLMHASRHWPCLHATGCMSAKVAHARIAHTHLPPRAAETEASLKKGAEKEGGAEGGASSSTVAQSVSETLKAAAGSFEQAAAAVREGVGKVADKVGSVASTLYNKVVGRKEGEL